MNSLHSAPSASSSLRRDLPEAPGTTAGSFTRCDHLSIVERLTSFIEADGAAHAAREVVVQLAVRGYLVPQDPNDETAAQHLARSTAHRKHKLAPSYGAAPFEIPHSWQWVNVGRITAASDYGTSAKAAAEAGDVPVLRMGNIQNGRVVMNNLKYVTRSLDGLPGLYLQPGDLLFNRTNSYELVGKTAVYTGPANAVTFASYLIRLRTTSAVVPAYLNLAMNSRYYRVTQIEPEITQQTGQANFNGTKLLHTLVPLPPLAEQKRIVARVDQLIALIEKLEAEQARKREAGTRFTKASLEALTTAEGPEDFDTAWKRIEGNFTLIAADVERVQQLRQAITDLALTLPHNREITNDVAVCDLVNDTRYGTARRCDRNESLTPVLRIPNVVRGVLALDDLKYTAIPANELNELRLRAGDVLVVRSNGSRDLVGRACVVDDRAVGFAFAGYLIRVRLRTDLVCPEWFQLALQGSAVRKAIEGPARTTSGVHNVNTKELLALTVPVPPLAVQAAVLRFVGRVTQLCDDLEAKLQRAEDRASKLVEATVLEMVG